MAPDPGEERIENAQSALRDPASLPPTIAVRILALAYLDDSRSASERENDARWRNNPLRTVAPLISKSWRRLLQTNEARAVLWRRARFTNACFGRYFDKNKFRAFWRPLLPGVLEVDIDLEGIEGPRMASLCPELVNLIRDAPSLLALRLAGPLPLGEMLQGVGPERLATLTALSSVLLSGGAEEENWGLIDAIEVLRALPALQILEIRFARDAAPPTDPGIINLLGSLTGLRHLALQWPLRSALPPCGEVPPAFSALSGLTTLQLRRVPLQNPSPPWLGALTALKHLYWDPWLPVDLTGMLPSQLASFKGLETLFIEMAPPLTLPPGLSSLRRLALVNRGVTGYEAVVDGGNGGSGCWDWLTAAAPRLESLRLQGGGISSLPPPVATMPALTRLELMCNDLTAESFPAGPWLQALRHLHLGGNCILSFPPALRHATALRSLHLANQRAGPGALAGPAMVPQRLRMEGEDVTALLAAPALETVVMAMGQPQVLMGGRTCDFEWLKRALQGRHRGKEKCSRRCPIKLTSNELAFELEPMEVFKWQHLTPEELNL
jgi:hypothetical protein